MKDIYCKKCGCKIDTSDAEETWYIITRKSYSLDNVHQPAKRIYICSSCGLGVMHCNVLPQTLEKIKA